ncbi:MAG: hypothetical protein KBD62_36975 [Kofleriaceae bacterium]|nr:hypothetical protein [Kofleriaceae bacterium]
MPTDLRAALRDLLTTRDEDEQERLARLEAAIAALTDTPPTVAELLPMVDATHEVRWTAFDDAETEVRARIGRDGGGNDVICVEWRLNDGAWEECQVYVADLTQHARLVEVTP